MAVLAIMAIVATTAIVRMSSLSDDRSAMAARMLLRDLAFARQRAVATGYKTWVDLSAADTWRLLAEDATNQTQASAQLLNDPATNDGFVQTVNSGTFMGVTFSVTVGESWIGFNWVGQPIKDSDEDQDPPSLAADAVYTFSGGQVVSVNKDTGHAVYTP
jgi:Tfp pilus assembly protein FimT